ncbi:MAG: coproporphyrinogen III oxidase family protein [Spirochaetaceae bacterium]|nr:MAG: coproporphyrinogen III oxidase family protein [Spirochaetaceae bacterium]
MDDYLESFGIYVHVPFCTSRCDYCAFHSSVNWTVDAQRTIVRRIIVDLHAIDPPRVPTTVYVGGGTPTALDPPLLDELLATLAARFAPVEFTLEANPESATDERLSIAAHHGVDRLSVGVQSLDPDTLRRIGRRGADVARIEAIRRRWPSTLSADLITGVPGVRPGSSRTDVDRLAAIGIDHVSVYGLSIEPETPLATRTRRGDAQAAEGWVELVDTIVSHGYRRYEVSNFSRGAPCLHNVGYWRQCDYIGVGPSAVSTIRVDPPDGSIAAIRIEQSIDHARWLSQPGWTNAATERLSMRDLMLEHLMLALRQVDGVSFARFTTRYGHDLRALAADEIDRLRDESLVVADRTTLRATRRGLDLLDPVLVRLFAAVCRNLDTVAT